MGFPEREYNSLKDVQKEWHISKKDMFYFVENGLLRACIWLPLRFMERVILKDKGLIYETHEPKEGFVGVRSEDCRHLFKNGRASLRMFNSISEQGHILRLAYEPPQPAIFARISDLVVLKEDQKCFEERYEISASNVEPLHPAQHENELSMTEDYRYARLKDMEFNFGDMQALVIGLLYDATQSNHPWVHGKTLIYESGSSVTRLRDLFKSQKNWSKLILSNGRGYYRLNVPLESIQISLYQRPSDSITKKMA